MTDMQALTGRFATEGRQEAILLRPRRAAIAGEREWAAAERRGAVTLVADCRFGKFPQR